MMYSDAELSKSIGQNLRARRQLMFPGDTQKDMAVRLGVGVATYSRMERGDSSVSMRHYLSAATILGCEKGFSGLFKEGDHPEGLIERLLKEQGSGR